MPCVKLTATVILTIILTISVLVSTAAASPSLSIYATAENKTSSSSSAALPSSINQIHGTLIVTQKVINEGGGNKKPSDFMINVHGNDPSPSSFPGNSSGTFVKLPVGMYSVTETGPSGYNSTLSDDCSGGMMSVETKNCIITNIYSKPNVSVK
jgi:prealbumin domain-containing protein